MTFLVSLSQLLEEQKSILGQLDPTPVVDHKAETRKCCRKEGTLDSSLSLPTTVSSLWREQHQWLDSKCLMFPSFCDGSFF